jgi:hypothetical protein
MSYGVRRHFQQYFSYIVAVSSISGVPRKFTDLLQVNDKLSHNFVSSTPRYERDLDLQRVW